MSESQAGNHTNVQQEHERLVEGLAAQAAVALDNSPLRAADTPGAELSVEKLRNRLEAADRIAGKLSTLINLPTRVLGDTP